jgi:hypothetical protein
VWVKQCPGRWYSALNSCLQSQLQWRFKIKLLNKDGVFIQYWLTLALTTIPENSGNLDRVSRLVQVRIALAAVVLQVLYANPYGGFWICTLWVYTMFFAKR